MELNAIRVQFKSGADMFDITLPSQFLSGPRVPSRYYHEHLKYEVVFSYMQNGEPDSILIVPPHCGHTAAFSEEEREVRAFQFSISCVETDREEGGIAMAFKTLKEPIRVEDTIHSRERLAEITEEILFPQFAGDDKLNAMFLLLMADIARLLPYVRDMRPKVIFRKVEDNTLEIIEEYFMQNYQRPGCQAEELAKELFISTRQLQRILRETYQMTFREMLQKVRMEKAIGYQRVRVYKAAELAELTGYSSVPAFYSAYRKYFGVPFQSLGINDINCT